MLHMLHMLQMLQMLQTSLLQSKSLYGVKQEAAFTALSETPLKSICLSERRTLQRSQSRHEA